MKTIMENWRVYQEKISESRTRRGLKILKPKKSGSLARRVMRRGATAQQRGISIEYGKFWSRYMGKDAIRMAKYFHPNDWWAETVMRVAMHFGRAHAHVFKFLYGSLMTWNLIKTPAALAGVGQFVKSILTDKKNEKKHDSPHQALAVEGLEKMLKAGAGEIQVRLFLADCRKLMSNLKRVEKTKNKKNLSSQKIAKRTSATKASGAAAGGVEAVGNLFTGKL
jgi:hypothetical protein